MATVHHARRLEGFQRLCPSERCPCGCSVATIWLERSSDGQGACRCRGTVPIDAGKQRTKHTSEPHQPDATRHSRTVQIREALLLSLVTIAAAWSGNAAAKWGTESRMELEAIGGAGGDPQPEPAEEPLTSSQPLALRTAPTRSSGPGWTTSPAAARGRRCGVLLLLRPGGARVVARKSSGSLMTASRVGSLVSCSSESDRSRCRSIPGLGRLDPGAGSYGVTRDLARAHQEQDTQGEYPHREDEDEHRAEGRREQEERADHIPEPDEPRR